jgi:hypothetical protein
MIASSWAPKAIFGGLLKGHKPVRYIYVDEAGTSAKEPVSVVAGIIIHADTQYMAVEKRLNEVLQLVPHELREGFVFHAKSVWSDRSYREVWSFADRLDFLKKVMAIPREMGLAIAVGMVRRDSEVPEGVGSREKFHHAMAFFSVSGVLINMSGITQPNLKLRPWWPKTLMV